MTPEQEAAHIDYIKHNPTMVWNSVDDIPHEMHPTIEFRTINVVMKVALNSAKTNLTHQIVYWSYKTDSWRGTHCILQGKMGDWAYLG